MKRNAMRTNLRQSILRSLGRYIAIVAIIALGAAIFVGLRMTKADMVATGQVYTDEQNMFDLRLVSTYGWGQEQLDQVEALAEEMGLVDVEGQFYTDLIARMGDETEDSVYRFYTLPQSINLPVLVSGRMPESPDECLADGDENNDSIIGKQVTISEGNEEDALDSVRERTLTVVGRVSSPLYIDMNRGNTSIGSGVIQNYVYVLPEAFDVDYYTEIHVTIPGDYTVYSDEYNDAMDAMAEKLEPYLEPLAEERFQQVLADAKEAYADGIQELEDGLREFKDGKHEANEELKDAYFALKDGEQELTDNEEMLADGEQQLADAKKQLEDSEVTLANSRATLKKNKADAEAQLDAAYAELTANSAAVSENLTLVNAGMTQLAAGMAELNSGISQLESGLAQLDAGINQVEIMLLLVESSIHSTEEMLALAENIGSSMDSWAQQLRERLQELNTQRSEYSAQAEELYGMRSEYGGQLDELYATRADLEAQKVDLEANRQTLKDAQAAITAGFAEIAANRSSMKEQIAAAEAQLAAGEAKITAGWREIEAKEQEIADGWMALEEGREKLAESWIEYEDGKREVAQELADAEAELRDAEQKLADAKETIDGMTESSLHILDRNTNVGYASLDSSSDIVAGVSKVFPVFFLLVAALVCITTMTRMVDEERTQIGTLKALGYSNGAIISKYMIYAGSSALVGCGLGVLAGSVVFPLILWEAYKIMLYIPNPLELTLDLGLCLGVVAAYTVVILLVTLYCCYRTLGEVPAELIRPKAPAAGKQLIFEKLPFWNRVSFLNKVTIRNIFRYHQRLAMMLVGIGGCTALLLTGFGLRDSIVNVVDFQFEDITSYDMEVYFSGGMTQENMDTFREETASSVQDLMFYHQTSVEIDFEDQVRDIYMIAASEDIQRFIDFHHGDTPLEMPGENELLISIGVAEALGIQEGDIVILRDPDMRTLEVTVSGVYYNHVYNYVILSPETIEAQWGETPELQMAFVKAAEGKRVHSVSAQITAMDNVMNVSVSEDLAGMVRNMMDALDLVVIVVVFCAGLLAATVLYNLTNININERIREIATIKVLGFNATETAMYIFKENLTLTVVGAGFGLILGKLLLDFVMSEIKINMVWFLPRALPMSYVLSIVMTILMAIIVDYIFYFKLEKINMAEALKSVE
ncbi:MAG: FtsX-like permease family protein [Oscillospiraceae bacterium]|nr:FtsX-like permease family protein [Oscillospiraceae bacterium]